ncbi:MAG: DUF3365 domain-containing protein [Candidatus Tectomicrobia bacterium]|nr:DUF3365 domain-containing protein [Candidatus Tectomicrobia bacterium]
MRDGMRLMIAALSVIMAGAMSGAAETARPQPDILAKAVQAIENLDALRSGLAGTLERGGTPADKTTFKQVCKPVGMQAKQMAKANGWNVIQMAAKYRNPKHQLDADGRQAHTLLEANPTLMGVWMRTQMDDQAGTRYFRRITVESTCLACHGPKDKRPAFVKQGYPDDRAYDFQAGDLRGIYSLFIPDAK